MKPVLIISYYFPPLGGAGTQRYAKFVKWLPEFGYAPIVVCSGERTSKSAPTADETLLADVPPMARVLRVPDGDARQLPFSQRALLAARFRTDFEEWVGAAWPVVERAVREYRPRAAIVTVSPYAAARLGERLGRAFGLPWILDLRDPWALDGWRTYPTVLHGLHDLRSMRRALRSADRVVASVPAARRAYLKLAGLPEDSVITIPNGFDPDDFPPPRPVDHAARRQFRIVHVGTLHSAKTERCNPLKAVLNWRWRAVENTARSARYLYLALAELRRQRPDLYEVVRLELYGHVHASHAALAAELGIADRIDARAYVPHAEAVQALVSADCVFVPLHDVPAGEEALIVPGKLYESIASERPVLACVPPGDAAALVRSSGAGGVCPPRDAAAICAWLIVQVAAWRDGAVLRGAPRARLAPFTRQALTLRLACLLDAITGGAAMTDAPDPWAQVVAPDSGSPVRRTARNGIGGAATGRAPRDETRTVKT